MGVASVLLIKRYVDRMELQRPGQASESLWSVLSTLQRGSDGLRCGRRTVSLAWVGKYQCVFLAICPEHVMRKVVRTIGFVVEE